MTVPSGCGWRRARRWAVLAALSCLSGACNGLFYYPDSYERLTPANLGLAYQAEGVREADGTTLALWHLRPLGAPHRGVIVHFHGNAENMTSHVLFVVWLVEAGYDVVTFDYRGYGSSTGTPDRAGLGRDAAAVIAWVRNQPQFREQPLFLYGQSLGGAVAAVAAQEVPPYALAGLIIESSFASYRGIARAKLGAIWLTWPFQYPLSWLVTDDERPATAIASLRSPLLVVHGSADEVVPLEQGRAIRVAYRGADGELWEVQGAGHTAVFADEQGPWRTRLLAWLQRHGRRQRRP